MPALSTLPLFAVASLVVLLIPGPSVLYIVARSSTQGTKAGLVSVAGVHTGSLVHVVAATVGLSALVMASAVAFTALKVVGGAYLIYLGIRTILDRSEHVAGAMTIRPLRRLFVDGFIVDVLNPKVALFFLAFLPQFVDPTRGPLWVQTLLLGLMYVAIGVVTDGGYAMVGAGLGRRVRALVAHRRRSRYVEGGLLIGLGIVSLAVPHRTAD